VTLAADYPFLNILWSMIVFFAFVVWLWMLFAVFADLFGRHDISGWGKAAWTILLIVLPYLGVFIYLIAHGSEMAQRSANQARDNQAQFDDYVREVAADGGPAAEIERAKKLLDEGAINQAEYDSIKRKALATG
jgi:hypothetical protein